jgi:peptidoglycan/LPS O-acetylase OafA/YrhL
LRGHVLPLRGHALTYLAGGPAIAAPTAVLLVSRRAWRDASTPWLRAVAWLGSVSHCAYPMGLSTPLWLRPSWGELAGRSAMVLTMVAAAASWHVVERPVQPRRTPGPARS